MSDFKLGAFDDFLSRVQALYRLDDDAKMQIWDAYCGNFDPKIKEDWDFTTDVGQQLQYKERDRVYHFGATMQRGSLPFTVQRARALLDWFESGGFTQALASAGEPQPRCPTYSHIVRSGSSFCGQCGARLLWASEEPAPQPNTGT